MACTRIFKTKAAPDQPLPPPKNSPAKRYKCILRGANIPASELNNFKWNDTIGT